MEKAIERALRDLDGLADGAIRKRILGEQDEGAAETGAPLATGAVDQASPEGVSEAADEEITPELLQKLRDALSK